MICNQCPRQCGADRANNFGFCRSEWEINLARAAPHFWEEPCISGDRGSGTVFFTGCNLGCIYCQNKDISRGGKKGKNISPEKLAHIFEELKQKGVHNINLVTGAHFTDGIIQAMDISAPLPFVYNSSGYESLDTIKKFSNRISIWLPDFKYADSNLAKHFSNAENYPRVALEAILQMYRSVGKFELDENGLMKKGLIIRHLILPGHIDNTKAVIDIVCDNFPKSSVMFSLMSQYTPPEEPITEYPELNRRISQKEYDEAYSYMLKKGIYNAYVQELSSAKKEYTPDFDLTGVI